MPVAQSDSDPGGGKSNEVEKGWLWGDPSNGACQKGSISVVHLTNSQQVRWIINAPVLILQLQYEIVHLHFLEAVFQLRYDLEKQRPVYS